YVVARCGANRYALPVEQVAEVLNAGAMTTVPGAPAEVLGLLGLIDHEATDVFELAERLGKEFGAVVRLVKAAELLGLVQTPGQDVEITPLGREALAAVPSEQKRMVREQLFKLKIFELLIRLITVQKDQLLSEEELVRELAMALPHEKPRQLFRTILSWGRYAEIISYDQRKHLIRLYEGRRAARATPNADSATSTAATTPGSASN
ncbi:MAG: AAA-associated domain-containing protein, partial [Opitutaceae bacterium]